MNPLRSAILAVIGSTLLAGAAQAQTCDWPLWQNYAKRFIQDDGRVLNSSMKPTESSSEGQSYAMFFALVGNDRATFDKLWTWTKSNMAGADIGLVPSVDEPYLAYSLSTKLLEYAAMGVPIVATDLATFRHHFSDEAIRFVPGGEPLALAAAIEALAANPQGSVAMGLAAQREAAAYDWERQKAVYRSIVDRLVG